MRISNSTAPTSSDSDSSGSLPDYSGVTIMATCVVFYVLFLLFMHKSLNRGTAEWLHTRLPSFIGNRILERSVVYNAAKQAADQARAIYRRGYRGGLNIVV